MSYVLEGVVVPVDESVARAAAGGVEIEFDVLPLNAENSILARPGRPRFASRTAEIAASLSLTLGQALLVRWDDRVGFRESRVYAGGSELRRFTTDDEVYVMLDDDGMPVDDGTTYSESELEACEDDSEFQVFQNALELGCGHAGFCEWSLLQSFISHDA